MLSDATGINNNKIYCICLHFISHLGTYNNYNHKNKISLMTQRVLKC